MEGYVPGDAISYHGEQQYYSMHGEFEEHVEIDKEEGKYEKIEVPEFADCKQATILHDFDKVCYPVLFLLDLFCIEHTFYRLLYMFCILLY